MTKDDDEFCDGCITTMWCRWKGGCMVERVPPANLPSQERETLIALVEKWRAYAETQGAITADAFMACADDLLAALSSGGSNQEQDTPTVPRETS